MYSKKVTVYEIWHLYLIDFLLKTGFIKASINGKYMTKTSNKWLCTVGVISGKRRLIDFLSNLFSCTKLMTKKAYERYFEVNH